jgi:hypothetical protein
MLGEFKVQGAEKRVHVEKCQTHTGPRLFRDMKAGLITSSRPSWSLYDIKLGPPLARLQESTYALGSQFSTWCSSAPLAGVLAGSSRVLRGRALHFENHIVDPPALVVGPDCIHYLQQPRNNHTGWLTQLPRNNMSKCEPAAYPGSH